MARTVFILGAGASAACGAPLMKDFLRSIRDLSKDFRETEYAQDFALVLKGYERLRAAYATMQMNYEANFEELYSTFEMARILRSDIFTEPEADRLSQAMKRVIGATIESRMIFSTANRSDTGITFYPHRHYIEFVKVLRDLSKSKRPDSSIALLTFNYDIGLDYALTYTKTPFRYCLEPDESPASIPLLKLHGSLNWAQCPECSKVVSLPQDMLRASSSLAGEASAPFYVSRCLPQLSHCGKALPTEPFIVPPTWNKTEYQRTVADVWMQAARELSEASNVFVCGYSLPITDQFFRHLLALSFSHGQIIDHFAVVNPDSTSIGAFNSMLSEQVRAVFVAHNRFFEQSFNDIRSTLKLSGDQTWNENWDAPL